jgi:hypothetical protein
LQNIVVPEAENTPPALSEEGVSAIVLTGFRMLAAIAFDDELRFNAGEIDDIGRDRKLASEAEAQLAVPQSSPQRPLRIGRLAP